MKTFFFLLAFFSSCCLFSQNTEWQDKLVEKMRNEEKSKTNNRKANDDFQIKTPDIVNNKDTITTVVNREDEIREDTIREDEIAAVNSADTIAAVINSEDTIKTEEPIRTENEEEYQETSTSESDSSFIVPESWDTNFNNLLNSWYIKNFTAKINQTGYQENVPTSDSVYMDRLSKLPNIIELPFNNIVRQCIDLYVERRRNLVEYMLGLEPLYFPMIEESLNKYGLPLELKYLTIVESALNPTAFSRAGASGLWQFMFSTGQAYGLEINSLIDERRDPIKSTDAACRYLKDLYNTYGDWSLAIAAYNCGGGNVNKAIRRAKGQKDYWAIYPYLPKETRSYVPLFIAANYAMNYYANHQLYPVQAASLPLSTDTVMVSRMIHFDQISDILKVDKDMIRSLNPQYSRDIIPGNYKPQVLKLPAIQAYTFVEKEDEIASYRANELFTNRTYIDDSSLQGIDRVQKIIYRVSRGESVVSIANKFGLSAISIRRWNYLGSNKVPVGKKLILYIGGSENMDDDPVVKPSAAPSRKKSAYKEASVPTIRYKVKHGDTFSTIAEKYPGYSSKDLMKLNNKTGSVLKAGQYILVPHI